MGTMPTLFTPHVNVVGKLQVAQVTIKTLDKRGLLLAGVRHPMVSPMAPFKLKPHPNTLQASSTHTLGQCLYFLGPICI